jgi:hypothetical protein
LEFADRSATFADGRTAMNKREFYLASHDFGTDSRPRKCEVVIDVKGLRPDSRYVLVKVVPPMPTRFWDGPLTDFDQIILALVGNQTLQDVGTKPIMADIVICPTYSDGPLDERACSRIGVGSLHATYAEAIKASPVEER